MHRKQLKIIGLLLLTILVGSWAYLAKRNGPKTSEQKVSQKTVPLKVRGSIPYWDQDAAVASFAANVEHFDSISLFWYYIAEDGEVIKYEDATEDTTVIDFAHAHGVKVSAVLTNLPEDSGTTWDSDRVVHILEDSESQKEHIQQLMSTVERLSFDGIAIDFEEVDNDQSNNFSEYIANVSKAAHEKGLFVGVALHPKLGFVSDRNYMFQDWEEIAKYADELYIMAYGEHWDGGESGPIASIPWVGQIVRYAQSRKIPLSKFYLGIPLYGYDWIKNNDEEAVGLTDAQIKSLLTRFSIEPEWDETARAPHFSYEIDGYNHVVWYENIKSILEKAKLAKDAGFGGITFWRLGGEDSSLWDEIER